MKLQVLLLLLIWSTTAAALLGSLLNLFGSSPAQQSDMYDRYIQPMVPYHELNEYDFLQDDGQRCARNCTEYPESRICYFQFIATIQRSMGYIYNTH